MSEQLCKFKRVVRVGVSSLKKPKPLELSNVYRLYFFTGWDPG